MFLKKKEKEEVIVEKRKNIFNIPSDEAKVYLSSIIKDVHTIMESDKFMEATRKVKLPENATIKDYERLIARVAPNKVYNILMLFIDDCYDEVRRILSAIFISDFEEYRKKSLEEICQDIATLNTQEIGKIISFFIR